MFKDNKLKGMLTLVFKDKAYDVIFNAYPNRYKIWEFKTNLELHSDREIVAQAVRWVIEEKCKFTTREQVADNFSQALLNRYGLYAMVVKNGVYGGLNIAYPGKFKQWELKAISKGFWENTDNVKEALRWLLNKEKAKTFEQINKTITVVTMTKYGMGILLQIYTKHQLIDMMYPGKYSKEESRLVQNGIWNDKSNVGAEIRQIVEKNFKTREELLKG